MTTKVIFRKFKEGDVIALFPQFLGDNNYNSTCLSYQHLGQHGTADIGIVSDTDLCTPDEYHDLLEELIYIGYDDIVIANRFTRLDYKIRKNEFLRIQHLN